MQATNLPLSNMPLAFTAGGLLYVKEALVMAVLCSYVFYDTATEWDRTFVKKKKMSKYSYLKFLHLLLLS